MAANLSAGAGTAAFSVVGGGSGAVGVGVAVSVAVAVAVTVGVPPGDAVPVAAVVVAGGGVPPGEHEVSSIAAAASKSGMVVNAWRAMGDSLVIHETKVIAVSDVTHVSRSPRA